MLGAIETNMTNTQKIPRMLQLLQSDKNALSIARLTQQKTPYFLSHQLISEKDMQAHDNLHRCIPMTLKATVNMVYLY